MSPERESREKNIKRPIMLVIGVSSGLHSPAWQELIAGFGASWPALLLALIEVLRRGPLKSYKRYSMIDTARVYDYCTVVSHSNIRSVLTFLVAMDDPHYTVSCQGQLHAREARQLEFLKPSKPRSVSCRISYCIYRISTKSANESEKSLADSRMLDPSVIPSPVVHSTSIFFIAHAGILWFSCWMVLYAVFEQ